MSDLNKIILTDKQELGRRILMENNQYIEILFDGGARAGKTFLILLVIILYCIQYQGLRVLISRMQFNSGKKSLWIQSLIPLLKQMKIKYHENKTDFIVTIGKSEIWLGGLDSKERADKVLGQEYGLIFLNEAVEIPISTRDIVKTRLAQNVDGFSNFLIYDCNPRQPYHFLYQEFYIDVNKKKISLKFLPEDNKENLPPGYIENILMKLPKDKKARFLRGEWTYLPGAVYKNVKEKNKIICEKNIYHFYDDIAVGIDWGYYMCAIVWGFKRTKKSIQAYCIHEIIILDGITEDLVKELDKIYGIKEENHICYCDHEPDRIKVLENAGYAAKPAYKEVGAGDSSVNSCELYFDVKCKRTFQSMVNLTNQEDPSGRGFLHGKHVKEMDHECLVGDTSILTDKGQVKIKDIKIGDMVLTRQGYKKVYAQWMTGIKNVYEFKIGKNKIICTNNHKFYCANEDKFKEIFNFHFNDILYCINDNTDDFCKIDWMKHRYKGMKKVYSISVEDVHEYFANNILVKNSDASRYAIHGWIMDNNIEAGGHFVLK